MTAFDLKLTVKQNKMILNIMNKITYIWEGYRADWHITEQSLPTSVDDYL